MLLSHTKALQLMAIITVIIRTQRTFYDSPFSIGPHLNSWARHQKLVLPHAQYVSAHLTCSLLPSLAGQPFPPFLPGELTSFYTTQFKSINISFSLFLSPTLFPSLPPSPLNRLSAAPSSVTHVFIPPQGISYFVSPLIQELQTSRADSQ